MPKYLVTINYTPEGAKGVHKDGGSKRRAAAQAAAKSLGGSIDAFYFSFGETDAVIISDMPDNVAAAALCLAVTESGAAETSTTPLFTAEEMDLACKKKVGYRAPGR
jgi:uncharacterized protein with GYD domain